MSSSGAFVQMLRLQHFESDAVEKVYGAIVRAGQADEAVPVLEPVLRPQDSVGTTRYVDFDTAKETYLTDPARSHVTHVVLDSNWEMAMAQKLEQMDEVVAYVKNQGLGFTIPYIIDGTQRHYLPDFIARIDDGHGPDDLLNLVIEVSGAQRHDKEAKVATTRDFWVPAVNNHGGFGRWGYVEVSDPFDATNTIRATLGAVQR